MSYYDDIPTFSRRAPTMKATSSSSGSSSSRMNHSVPSALTIPSTSGPSSNTSSTESYTQTTFRDFAHHAKKCERCYDPLATFNEGREMCPRGRQLAKLLTTSLFDEANEKYRRSHSEKKKSSRRMSTSGRDSRDDGWQNLEVDIPKGCEAVRSLLVAIDRGLQLPSSAATSPLMPSSSSPHKSSSSTASSNSSRVVLGETYDYVPSSHSRHHSDEEILGGRSPRRIHREEEKPHRSSRRSSSSGGDRKSHRRHSDSKVHEVSGGIEERERRPYVHNTRLEVPPSSFAPNSPRSSHDNLSIDSGYGTTGGCPSPDMGRGSQYAEDMRRRQHARSTAKSALKNSDSVERIHASYQAHNRTPSSPRMGKANGVGFNIEGHYFVPGYP